MRVVAMPLGESRADAVASLRRWNFGGHAGLLHFPWEGPFTGAERRLPQHPEVAARQREMCRRWARTEARSRLEAAVTERGAYPANGAVAWAASETASS